MCDDRWRPFPEELQEIVRPLILLILFSVVAAGSVPTHQDGDGADFSIAVNVRLVLFNVTVADDKGRFIPGLKSSNFRILDGGQTQEIKLFSAEDVPATIGLVIDNSGSMRSKQADVRLAALRFVEGSNPDDQIFLIDFNDKAHRSLPEDLAFTNDPEKVRSALLQMIPDGRTSLYDAVAMALEHLKTGSMERKALVVLSDGGDNASRISLEQLIPMAVRSNATIYTIGIYDDTDADRNPNVLQRIAKAGGGRAYFPRSAGSMVQVWNEIAGEIRSQYSIGFIPNGRGTAGVLQKVKITASRNGGGSLRVNAREGYVVP